MRPRLSTLSVVCVLALDACSAAAPDTPPGSQPAAPMPASQQSDADPISIADAASHATRDGSSASPMAEDAALAQDAGAAGDAAPLGAFDASASAVPSHGGTITFQRIGAA